MPNYGTAVLTSAAAAAGAPYATFHTTTRRARIYKFLVTTVSALQSAVGLIRSSNVPTATVSVTPQPYDTADAAATALLDTAWGVAPTVGANFLEEFTLGPAIGAGNQEAWQSDKEITLATAVWLVIWNSGALAGSALSITIAYDE